MTVGRIVERLGDALGLLRGVDMRHNDAKGAVVERAGALIERAGTDAHDRRDAGGQRGDAMLRRFLNREGAVLGGDEEPIMPGRGGQKRHRRGAKMMNPEAERHAPFFDATLGGVLNNRHPPLLPAFVSGQNAARPRPRVNEGSGQLPLWFSTSAITFSSRSASAAGLSVRMRAMRGKRSATPDLCRDDNCAASKATSRTRAFSTSRTGPKRAVVWFRTQ